jgi:hypothetical protein
MVFGSKDKKVTLGSYFMAEFCLVDPLQTLWISFVYINFDVLSDAFSGQTWTNSIFYKTKIFMLLTNACVFSVARFLRYYFLSISFCRISLIHFSFLFISAARFFLGYHRKISSTVTFCTSFVLSPHFFQPIHPHFSLPALRGLPLPVHALPPFYC